MLKLQRVEDILLFLTLLFLPTQLGKHFWPDFSYIYSLKVDYLSPTIYFWDILVVGLLIVWILTKPALPAGRPKINQLALGIFLFFILTQTISLLGALNIAAGLVRLEQYLIAGLFGVFLASQDSRSLSRKIYLPLFLGVLGESILAILQFLRGETLGLWILGERTFTISTPGIAKFDFYGSQFLRPYGTFPHPNVLAGFLIISIIILRDYGGSSKLRRFPRLAIAGLGMTAGLTIFLTMGRVAILAGLAVLTLVLKKKWLIFLGLLILVLSPFLFLRFSSLFNFDNLTVLRREQLLGSATEIFLQSPFFGVGLNNFIPAMANNLVSGPSRFLQPVHNIFFLILAETGLIGLIGLIALIGYPIKKIFNLLPWLIILFLGMFDHYFLTLPQGYRLLFLLWGLSFSMIK